MISAEFVLITEFSAFTYTASIRTHPFTIKFSLRKPDLHSKIFMSPKMFEQLADDINNMFNETVTKTGNGTIGANPSPLEVLDKSSSIAIMVATGLLLIFIFFLFGFCMQRRYRSRPPLIRRDTERVWPGRSPRRQKTKPAVIPKTAKTGEI